MEFCTGQERADVRFINMHILFSIPYPEKVVETMFSIAIENEYEGYENSFGSSALYDAETKTWTTAWSGFTYRIVTGTGGNSRQTTILYEGARNGFLQQDLIPSLLKGFDRYRTMTVQLVESSVFGRFEKVPGGECPLDLVDRARYRARSPEPIFFQPEEDC